MEVNVNKSKVMHVTKEIQRRIHIEWDGKIMEQVENFEYLGTIINSKGKIDMEINHRINKANQIYYQINQTLIGKKEINNATKIRIYRVLKITFTTFQG